jgi:acyl carrier protein
MKQRLSEALPDERSLLLTEYLGTQVSQIIGWKKPATLDLDESLASLGLDSLMAVELRNRIQADLAIAVPVAQLLQGPSVNQLVTLVLDQTSAASTAQPIASARPDQILSNLDQLSEDEVDSLLNDLLANQPPAESG